MTQNPPVFEVLPRDLSAYRQGNVGIDYVHRFESGKPGPHVLINALTHGNEICGMVAATHLLDKGVRPLIGTLTISFANVAAYESFDQSRPFESRQLVHNLNRIWSAAELDGTADSPELQRARVLRPVVAAADHILDIHSTSQDVQPFWVYPAYPRNAEAALAIGRPPVHLVMPSGLGSGTPLIQHGRHGQAEGGGVAVGGGCGPHLRPPAADLAPAGAPDLPGPLAPIAPGAAPPPPPPPAPDEPPGPRPGGPTAPPPPRPAPGFEVFAKGDLIATDGPHEIRALCDDCTILMPTREPIVGREAVYLTRPI